MIVAGVFVLISTGLVQAELVTGVTVHDYSTQHATFPATLSVNGTTTSTDGGGLTYQSPDVWHHENVADNMYLALGGNVTAWLEFDLGALATLTEIHLWNYNLTGNEGDGDPKTERGAKLFDVYVSDTGGTANNQTPGVSWTKIATDLTLAEADGLTTYAGQRFDLTDTVARYVRIDMTTNYTGAILGLSEAHFYANFPVDLNLTNNGDDQWTTVGNWVTNGTANPHGSLPTRIDAVWVTGAMELSGGTSVTGTASDVTMNSGADFTITGNATLNASDVSVETLAGITITDNATLNASAVTLQQGSNTGESGGNLTVAATGILNATTINGLGKQSRLWNYGVINLTGNLDWDGRYAKGYNYGTINADGNLIVDSNLTNPFENSGIFNGNALVGDGTISLTGGTMTFGSQTFFTTAGGVVNLSNDGTLIFEGQNYVTLLQGLIGTKLNGVTADLVVYVGGDTVVPYYVKGTVMSIH